MKDVNKFKDAALERAVIGTVIKNGKETFYEAEILQPKDFSHEINQKIWKSLSDLASDPTKEIDGESIKLQLSSDKSWTFDQKKSDYIDAIQASSFSKKNVCEFATKLKNLAIFRQLIEVHSKQVEYVYGLTGNEKLSDVISNIESDVVNVFLNSGDADIEDLSGTIIENVENLIQMEPVDQVGIPTGFPIWDSSIGGGPRRASVNVIASRAKAGKSYLANNFALNVAKLGIPVLILDSELTLEVQQNRLVCIESECPIAFFETGEFAQNEDMKSAVQEAAKRMSNYPISYRNIASLSPAEVLIYIKKWITKTVGFNEHGKANDCLVIYDYLKLASGEGLSKHTPEYLLLGLIITELQNLAIKYEIPVIAFCQTNRDGIDESHTGTIAGSDRILWLCSSLSVLRNKIPPDIEMGSSFEHGNKTLKVLEARFGPGMELDDDFINLHASLKPNIKRFEATGRIIEGDLHSLVANRNRVEATKGKEKSIQNV